MYLLFAGTTVDRFPVVKGILVTRGILAGGTNVTIVGDRLDEYPVLGAWFETDGLPHLYAYAVPSLRFQLTFSFVLSTNTVIVYQILYSAA